jgi:hypothetical protein
LLIISLDLAAQCAGTRLGAVLSDAFLDAIGQLLQAGYVIDRAHAVPYVLCYVDAHFSVGLDQVGLHPIWFGPPFCGGGFGEVEIEVVGPVVREELQLLQSVYSDQDSFIFW